MIKLLAAFLNSPLITWYVNKTGVTSGMGTTRWFGVTVESIPVPTALECSASLERLVEDLLDASENNRLAEVGKLESEIEGVVSRAYGLTDAEETAIRSWKDQAFPSRDTELISSGVKS